MTDEFELDYRKAMFRCPECKESEGFWENVTVEAWRAIVVEADLEGNPLVTSTASSADSLGRYGGDWGYEEGNVFPAGTGGCGMCAWTGRVPGDLEFHAPKRVGWDGKPVRKPLPGQLELVAR